ncbi:hypothetical protein QJS10_CPB20g00955 [Acorus calamus]|uniref:Reverse transcriptase domain-containing protein n=1 Tax=Acorus calamus TaxID=4465 RepID=A0AAV9CE42_ACOCL|nr:hypothetical protein QJS10_CPB20g00955 [Acorus calamus]
MGVSNCTSQIEVHTLGDPLSPLIFTLVIQSLSSNLNRLVAEGFIGQFIRGRLNITHLGFADNLLVFTNTELSTVTAISQLFQLFARESRLHLNSVKSQIFASESSSSEPFATALNIGLHSLSVRFLGLPLFQGKRNNRFCSPLLDKIRKKIYSWTGHSLSKAGRAELIRSTVRSHSGCSSSWQAIMRARDWIASKVLRYLIFEGKTITLWFDPWINGRGIEEVDHLFLGCAYSEFIWSILFRELTIRGPIPCRLESLPLWLATHISEPFIKEVSHLILTTTIWNLWIEQNNRVFSNNQKQKHKLALLQKIKDSIKANTHSRVI